MLGFPDIVVFFKVEGAGRNICSFLLFTQNQLVMPKYELVKETTALGDSHYFTERDGIYVEDSVKIDFTEAVEVFEKIVLRQSKKEKEIIKTVEI